MASQPMASRSDAVTYSVSSTNVAAGSVKARRFLFTPLASTGYVYPAIGIAKALARRGHRIGFATGRQFRKLLQDQGFDFLPPLIGDTQAFSVRKWGLVEGLQQQAAHTTQAVECFHPDAIVTSALTISPLVVAAQRKTPNAVIGMGTYPWPALTGPSSIRKFAHAESLFRNMTELYQTACEIVGLTPSEHRHLDHSPLLGNTFLLRNIREFFPSHDSFPGPVNFVGDCSWEPEFQDSQDPEILHFLNQPGPIIFVQHDGKRNRPYLSDGILQSAVKDYLPYVRRHARAKRIRLLVSTNQPRSTDGGDDLSSGVLYRKHVPYRFVLPRVDAVIGNGSSSVMLAALVHGRPMAFFHHGAESNFVARQCLNAKAALIHRSDQVTDQIAAETVDQLLSNRALKRRAIEYQEMFNAIDSPSLAAGYLESIAAPASVSS